MSGALDVARRPPAPGQRAPKRASVFSGNKVPVKVATVPAHSLGHGGGHGEGGVAQGHVDMDPGVEGEWWFELFYDLIFVAAAIKMGHVVHSEFTTQNVLMQAFLFGLLWSHWAALERYMTFYHVSTIAHLTLYTACSLGTIIFAMNISSHIALQEAESIRDALALSMVVNRAGVLLAYVLTAWNGTSVNCLRSHMLPISYVLSCVLFGSAMAAEFRSAVILLLAGALLEVLMHAAQVMAWLGEPDDDGRHLEHTQDRQGCFLMLIIGESMIQLVANESPRDAMELYAVALPAAILAFAISVLHFDTANGQRLSSALRPVPKGTGLIWTYASGLLSFAVLNIGIGIKGIFHYAREEYYYAKYGHGDDHGAAHGGDDHATGHAEPCHGDAAAHGDDDHADDHVDDDHGDAEDAHDKVPAADGPSDEHAEDGGSEDPPEDAQSPAPTAEPSPAPTAEPSPAPTAEPSPAPTAEPSPAATPAPSLAPTSAPSPAPTAAASPAPTELTAAQLLEQGGFSSLLFKNSAMTAQLACVNHCLEFEIDDEQPAAPASTSADGSRKLRHLASTDTSTVGLVDVHRRLMSYNLGHDVSLAEDPEEVRRRLLEAMQYIGAYQELFGGAPEAAVPPTPVVGDEGMPGYGRHQSSGAPTRHLLANAATSGPAFGKCTDCSMTIDDSHWLLGLSSGLAILLMTAMRFMHRGLECRTRADARRLGAYSVRVAVAVSMMCAAVVTARGGPLEGTDPHLTVLLYCTAGACFLAVLDMSKVSLLKGEWEAGALDEPMMRMHTNMAADLEGSKDTPEAVPRMRTFTEDEPVPNPGASGSKWDVVRKQQQGGGAGWSSSLLQKLEDKVLDAPTGNPLIHALGAELDSELQAVSFVASDAY